jgi:hypothetical protein
MPMQLTVKDPSSIWSRAAPLQHFRPVFQALETCRLPGGPPKGKRGGRRGPPFQAQAPLQRPGSAGHAGYFSELGCIGSKTSHCIAHKVYFCKIFLCPWQAKCPIEGSTQPPARRPARSPLLFYPIGRWILCLSAEPSWLRASRPGLPPLPASNACLQWLPPTPASNACLPGLLMREARPFLNNPLVSVSSERPQGSAASWTEVRAGFLRVQPLGCILAGRRFFSSREAWPRRALPDASICRACAALPARAPRKPFLL